VARALDLRVIGTLGVLLAAKRRALVPQLRPLLDRLVAQSFFIGPELYAELLHLAEESET
jgi:predicted nucleic acid-binding protein